MSSHPSPSVSAWPKLIPFPSQSSLDLPEIGLDYAVVLVGCIVFAYMYLLPKEYKTLGMFGGKLYSKDGYAIPNGPVGLPIVGMSFDLSRLIPRLCTEANVVSRIVSIPFALPGAHAGLLVQEVRSPVFSAARKSALRRHQRSWHHERLIRH